MGQDHSQPSQRTSDVAGILECFEEAWQTGPPPEIGNFITKAPESLRRNLLCELIKIDLEHRWRRGDNVPDGGDLVSVLPAQPLLEDYQRAFACLELIAELPVGLIAEEYRVRHRWGDRPAHEEFAERFPEIRGQLLQTLAEVDAQLSQRTGNASPVAAHPPGPSTETTRLSFDADQATPAPRQYAGDVPPPSQFELMTDDALRLGKFGPYELREEIARGGMGVVFKAWEPKLERFVALKLILGGVLAAREDVQRFYTEARAAAKLGDHPHIVPIHDVGSYNGQHYISMAYIEGVSLAQRLEQGPLPPAEAVQLVRSIADAVQYAHEHHVVHRDLKPSNVLLDKRGRPRVTDFGLAKLLDAGDQQTSTGQVLGTPSYMSPEQAGGQKDKIGPLSDVYALGAILYCLLTGRPPFQSSTAMETLIHVLQIKPAPPRKHNPAIDAALEKICLKCLEKQPDRRFESTGALIEALDGFLAKKPVESKPATTKAAKATTITYSVEVAGRQDRLDGWRAQPRSSHRFRWLLLSGAALTVCLLILWPLSSRQAPFPSGKVKKREVVYHSTERDFEHRPTIEIPASLAKWKTENLDRGLLTEAQAFVEKLLKQKLATGDGRKALLSDNSATPGRGSSPADHEDEFTIWLLGSRDMPENLRVAAARDKSLHLALALYENAKTCQGSATTLRAVQQLIDQTITKLKYVEVDNLPDEIRLLKRLGGAAAESKDDQWPKDQCALLLTTFDKFQESQANALRRGINLSTLGPAQDSRRDDFFANLLAAELWIGEARIPLARRIVGSTECLMHAQKALAEWDRAVALAPAILLELPQYAMQVGAQMDRDSNSELLEVVRDQWKQATHNDALDRIRASRINLAKVVERPERDVLNCVVAFDNGEMERASNHLADAKEVWNSQASNKDSSGIWKAFWAIQLLTLDRQAVMPKARIEMIAHWCAWAELRSMKQTDAGKNDEIVHSKPLWDTIDKAYERSKFNRSDESPQIEIGPQLPPRFTSDSAIHVVNNGAIEFDEHNQGRLTLRFAVSSSAHAQTRRLELRPASITISIGKQPQIKPDENGGIDVSAVDGLCELTLAWADEPDLSEPLELILLEEQLLNHRRSPPVPVAAASLRIAASANSNLWKLTFTGEDGKPLGDPGTPKAPGIIKVPTFGNGLLLNLSLTRPPHESSTSIVVIASTPGSGEKLRFEVLKEGRLAPGGTEMPLVLQGPPQNDQILPEQLVFEIVPNQSSEVKIPVAFKANTATHELIEQVTPPTYVPAPGDGGSFIQVVIKRRQKPAADFHLPPETPIPVKLEIAGFPGLTAAVEDVPVDLNLPISILLTPDQLSMLKRQSRELNVWLNVAGVPHAYRWHGSIVNGFEPGFRDGGQVTIVSPRRTQEDETTRELDETTRELVEIAIDDAYSERAADNLRLEVALYSGFLNDAAESNSLQALARARFTSVPCAQRLFRSAEPTGSWKVSAFVGDHVYRIPQLQLLPGKYTWVARLVGRDGSSLSDKTDVDVVQFSLEQAPPPSTP